MLAKGRATVDRLLPRVGLLAEACRRAGIDMVGVPLPTHALSPKGEQVVAYVIECVAADGPYVRLVPAIVFRFHRAADALATLSHTLGRQAPTPEQLEELRRSLSFLTRFPEQVKHDPVLAELFPAPVTVPTAQAPAPIPKPRLVSTEDVGLRRAHGLIAYCEPRMAQIRLMASMLDPTRALNRAQVMTEMGHSARALAQRLRRYPGTMGRLQDAERLFIKLKREVDLRGSDMRPDELGQLLEPLLDLVTQFHRTMELGELFPTNQMPSFER